MPVKAICKPIAHVNPALNAGEVYKIIRGRGTGRVFVMTSGSRPFIQYLAGTGTDGWDSVDALERSDFVVVTLQEV
jgi:hypothetical protein